MFLTSQFSWKHFVVGLIILSVCTVHTSADDHQTRNKDKKIIVVGAGMSGISAAKTLHDHGYTNIQILEGSDRVGGRVKSVYFSGYPVELGAQWIYGAGSNPMMKLATKYNLNYKLDPDEWIFRDAMGNDVTEKGEEEYEKLEEALDKLGDFSSKMRKEGISDIVTDALLRHFGWEPDNNVADAVEVYERDVESGKETSALSGKYLYHFQVFKDHDSDDWFIVNDTRGYSFIIEQMKEEFLPSDDGRIVFKKKVSRIENWDNENSKVKVYTNDGVFYEADYVIVTFSLGVLQSRNVIFSPPLPDWKMTAIDKFGFGQYNLMYFKFTTAFWDNVSSIIYVSERHGQHCMWFNMNFIFPGCNILQLAITGSEATAANRMEDSKLIAEAMRVFKSMYPSAVISEPENFITSRWISDPLTMGSVSYWTPGFTPEDMDDLGQRTGRLYFAGEHINKTNHAFVHSAYTSGINTALELMACIEDKRVCKHRVRTNEAGSECTSGISVLSQQPYRNAFVVMVVMLIQMKLQIVY